jgi:hypothetical protein
MKVQLHLLFEEEATRQPAKRRLAFDVLLVGADHVAFHAPAADQAVEPPQRGVWLGRGGVFGHEVPP